jgi:hypothetical protein
MAKKSAIRESADDAKAIAQASFGSAAISATGAVLKSFARVLDRGKTTVEQATPVAQKAVGDLVSKRLLPAKKKRATPKRKKTVKKAAKKVAKKKPAAKRAAAKKKKSTSRRKP